MKLIERIIEIVKEHEGNKLLADSIICELIEWGPISPRDGELFDELWGK
jgi:hypothetical protein